MYNLDKTIYVNLAASILNTSSISNDATISCKFHYLYLETDEHEQDLGAITKVLDIRVNNEPMKGWVQDEIYDDLLAYVNSELDFELMEKIEDGSEVDLPIDDDEEPKTVTSNHIQDIETDTASLEVYQCGCGYHMGFDISYLEQVESVVSAECPSCKNIIQTRDI